MCLPRPEIQSLGMRRPWLLLLALTLGGVGGWLWLSPGELRIDVDPRSREIALLFPPEARGRPPAEAVARALAELAAPERRSALRADIARAVASANDAYAFGFTPEGLVTLRPVAQEPASGGKVLPGLARVQLRGVPHGYLLVYAEPAQGLLATAARRRWLGRALIEAGAVAESATIAVGENDDGSFLVATVAFAYRTSDEAEAALRRLTAKQGDFEALGFAARPGTERLTRQTKRVVIRFDIETAFVLQALPQR